VLLSPSRQREIASPPITNSVFFWGRAPGLPPTCVYGARKSPPVVRFFVYSPSSLSNTWLRYWSTDNTVDKRKADELRHTAIAETDGRLLPLTSALKVYNFFRRGRQFLRLQGLNVGIFFATGYVLRAAFAP